jgi:hypothetical protein
VTTTTAEQLPTDGEIDLVDYKSGTLTSDLDVFVSSVERAMGPTIPLEDAVFMERNGIDSSDNREPLDDATLARWLVFTAGLLDDAEIIRKAASRMQVLLACDYRDRHQTGPEVARYWDQVRAWHREASELRRGGGDA